MRLFNSYVGWFRHFFTTLYHLCIYIVKIHFLQSKTVRTTFNIKGDNTNLLLQKTNLYWLWLVSVGDHHQALKTKLRDYSIKCILFFFFIAFILYTFMYWIQYTRVQGKDEESCKVYITTIRFLEPTRIWIYVYVPAAEWAKVGLDKYLQVLAISWILTI